MQMNFYHLDCREYVIETSMEFLISECVYDGVFHEPA